MSRHVPFIEEGSTTRLTDLSIDVCLCSFCCCADHVLAALEVVYSGSDLGFLQGRVSISKGHWRSSVEGAEGVESGEVKKLYFLYQNGEFLRISGDL